ncbi:MAG: P-loop NTPase [Acidobacteria bacterium]|nr:P-loop NTPase [Acidobacteriota bacterium]
MWKAAIVGLDENKIGHIRACLEQTGLVGSIVEWNVPKWPEPQTPPKGTLPDVILLGLEGNAESSLSFAADLRKSNPSLRILACSPDPPPDSKLLLAAMRSGVQEILAAPLTTSAVQEALTRFQDGHPTAGRTGLDKLILVMGSKGGVGTSTVAVNLAVQLMQVTERRVALLDLARPVGHVGLLLDLAPRFTIRDAAENIERLDSHFLSGLMTRHKSGLEILAGVSQTEEWHQILPFSLPGIINVVQNSYDYVVMDYGSVYSMEWLSALVLQQARTVLLIAEPNVPSLWTLERHVAALSSLWGGKDRIRIVINRWDRGDEEALKGLEKKIQCPIFARLPNDFPQVSEAVNLGTPLNRNHNNPLVTRFRMLAAQLAGPGGTVAQPSKDRGGLFSFFQDKVKPSNGNHFRNRN